MIRLFGGNAFSRIVSGYAFNKYKEVFYLAGYAIMLSDNQTRKFIRVNKAAVSLFGYTKAELKKMSLFDLTTQTDKVSPLSRNAPEEPTVKFARKKDGTIITIKCVTRISPRFTISIINDVTEEYRIRKALEHSEERLREAQHIGRFGWWEFNPETGEYLVSDEFYFSIYEDTTGPASFTYYDHLNNTHPEDRSYLRTVIEDALEKKKDRYNISYRIVTPSGKIKTIAVSAFLKYDENGRLLTRYGTCQDITETQKIMDEINEARRRAEESDKLKTTFLANFSHEIRTPLNAMMGFVNILTSLKTTESEKEEMINLIELNSQRLLRLINDMIDLSRIETNNLEVKYTNVEINKFLMSLVSSFSIDHDMTGKSGIALSLVRDETSAQIFQYVDELRLSQVFNNLLNNALKFTEKGSIQFGYNMSQKANYCHITYFVRDTGVGIPADKQDEIFNPFVQFWSEDQPKVQGAGLGLAICRRLIELMKGTIWVESTVGKGSTFYFSFNTPVTIE